MKKSIVASLLGLAVATAVTSAYGQGSINFDNYDSTPYMPVTYGSSLPAALAGQSGNGVADANFDVELLYALGANQAIGTLTPLPASIEAIDPSKTALGQGGYFDSLTVQIAPYVSGPVTFAVEAWYTGSTYAGLGGATYALSGFKGESFTWNETSLATGLSTANLFAGLPGPNGASLVAVTTAVPEPTTLALAGLGGAALLALRRKKA
jgi:hypothetical protein